MMRMVLQSQHQEHSLTIILRIGPSDIKSNVVSSPNGSAVPYRRGLLQVRVRVEKGAILIIIRGPLKVHNWVQHQINQSIEQPARRQ